MDSEKVKEIKKAIQETIDGKLSTKYLTVCEISCCPRLDIDKLFAGILTLINELESENERLVESCKNCHYIKDIEIANGHTKELKDQIAELEKENALIKSSVAMRDYKTLEEIINNRVKQFAEMLKNNCAYSFIFGQKFITEKRIDELLKEYENEKRNN